MVKHLTEDEILEQKLLSRQKPHELVKPTRENTQEELGLEESDLFENYEEGKIGLQIDPELKKSVQPAVNSFMAGIREKRHEEDFSGETAKLSSVGRSAQGGSNQFLDRQLGGLMKSDGKSQNKEVADMLIDLGQTVEGLNVGDLSNRDAASKLTKLIGGIFGYKNSVIRFINKYKTADGTFRGIYEDLGKAKIRLLNNNTTLYEEKKKLRKAIRLMKKAIAFLMLLDEELQKEINTTTDIDWKDILVEELQFPLKQRINALEKARVVNNQAILSFEMLMRTNKQLVFAIENSYLTVDALKVSIMIAFGIKDAQLITGAINKLDELGGDILNRNADQLATVVVDALKTGARAGIKKEKIISAHTRTLEAVRNYKSFIQELIPQLDEEIKALDKLNEEVEKENEKMERGTKLNDSFVDEHKELF